MGTLLEHLLLAQAQQAYQPGLFTFADVVRFILLLLLAGALLILVVNSWRTCNLLAEVRDLLRQGRAGTRARQAPQDAFRPPS
jgi:hypothetical protein